MPSKARRNPRRQSRRRTGDDSVEECCPGKCGVEGAAWMLSYAISAGAPTIRRRFESSEGGYGMQGLALRRVMIDRMI